MTAQLPLLGAGPPPAQAGPRVARRPRSQLRSLTGETEVAGPAFKAAGAPRLSRDEAHSATDPERLDLGPIFVQAVPLPSPPSEPLWGTASRKPFPTHGHCPGRPRTLCPSLTGARVSLGLVMGVRGRWTQSPGSGLGFSSKHPCGLDPSVKGTRHSRPGWLKGLWGDGSSSLSQFGGLRFTGGHGLGGWAHCGLCSLSSRCPASTLVAWPAPSRF